MKKLTVCTINYAVVDSSRAAVASWLACRYAEGLGLKSRSGRLCIFMV